MLFSTSNSSFAAGAAGVAAAGAAGAGALAEPVSFGMLMPKTTAPMVDSAK